jgi:hypothetical protein
MRDSLDPRAAAGGVTGDLAPMMSPRENRAWLMSEFPGRAECFARSLALAVWWGFLWQRRNLRRG